MLESSSVFLLLASVLGLVTGMKYMLAKQFFPYHAKVAGKEWPSLEGGVQIVIIGMLKIIGEDLSRYRLLWLGFHTLYGKGYHGRHGRY